MTFQGLLRTTILASPVFALAFTPAVAQQPAAPNPAQSMSPVTNEMLLNPPDGDWLMWRRTYNGWGYSPLSEINRDTVKDLTVAWSWAMTPGRTEATPLVHDGVLFLFNYSNKIQALNAATGDLIWEYKHELPENLARAGGNQSMRTMGIWQDKLIVATTDARILSLDAKSGQLVWNHQTADWAKGWRYSSGPLIVGDKIVQGMTGCGSAQPGGCFATGHDAETGNELWRFYAIARPGTPEGDTWNGLPLEARYGGSVWHSGAYDPASNLVYFGIAQPYPWIAEISGLLPRAPDMNNDALFTDATIALNADDGQLAWYYQHLKNDSLDLDHAYERMVIDLPVDGVSRHLVVSTGKIGIIEALDAATGEWVWATETVPQNVVAEITKTGEKIINEATVPHIGQTTQNCPADPGGRGWPSTAYNPENQNLYLPLAEFCSNTTPQPLDPGTVYTGGGRATFARVQVPNSDGNIGRIDAVDLSDQTQTWTYRQRAAIVSAVLPTGGGLLFAGTLDRYFRAHDADTGDILWQTRASNALNSFPISYAVDGKQYVAVVATDDSGVTRSWGSLTPEVVNPSDHGVTLWVYALRQAM